MATFIADLQDLDDEITRIVVYPSQQLTVANPEAYQDSNNAFVYHPSQQTNYSDLSQNQYRPDHKFNEPEFENPYRESILQIADFLKTGKGLAFLLMQTSFYMNNKRSGFIYNPLSLASNKIMHVISSLDSFVGRTYSETVAKNPGDATAKSIPAFVPFTKWGNVEQVKGALGNVDPTGQLDPLSVVNDVLSNILPDINLFSEGANRHPDLKWDPTKTSLDKALKSNNYFPGNENIRKDRTNYPLFDKTSDNQSDSFEGDPNFTLSSDLKAIDKQNENFNTVSTNENYRNLAVTSLADSKNVLRQSKDFYEEKQLVNNQFLKGYFRKTKRDNRINLNEKDSKNIQKINTHYDYSKIDKVNSSAVMDSDNDSLADVANEQLVPFYFYNLDMSGQASQVCFFRAYLSQLNESFASNWNELSFFGRSENAFTYMNTNRTINFSFILAVKHPDELKSIYSKINWLAQNVYPKFDNKRQSSFFLKPPIILMSLGNLYNALPAKINSLDIDYMLESESTWEINIGNSVPKMIKISMAITPLHEQMPSSDMTFYDILYSK